MNLFRKIQPLVVSLVFVAVAAGVLLWLWVGIDNFGGKLYARMQTIANERALKNQYTQLLATVGETQEEREALAKFVLTDENDTIALLSQIDEIAHAHNLELTTSDLKVIEKSGDFDDLSVSFHFEGGKASVEKMIQMFETLPYHGYITSLSVHRGAAESSGYVSTEASISLLLSIRNHD